MTLTQEELEGVISKGKHSSQMYRNAYMLLNCDEGKYGDKITGKEICRVLKVSMRMIDRVKKRFVDEGFEACIERKPASRTRERKADGELEARLIALSCSKPPKSHGKWTLRLIPPTANGQFVAANGRVRFCIYTQALQLVGCPITPANQKMFSFIGEGYESSDSI